MSLPSAPALAHSYHGVVTPPPRRTRDLIASIMSARSALLALGRNTAFAPMCATTMTAIGARAYSTGTSNRDRIATSQSRRRLHHLHRSSSSVVIIHRDTTDRPNERTGRDDEGCVDRGSCDRDGTRRSTGEHAVSTRANHRFETAALARRRPHDANARVDETRRERD